MIFICQSDLRLLVISAEINSEIIRIENVQNSFECLQAFSNYKFTINPREAFYRQLFFVSMLMCIHAVKKYKLKLKSKVVFSVLI